MHKGTLLVLLCLGMSVLSTIDVSKFEKMEISEEDIEHLFGLWVVHEAPVHIEPTVERYNYFKSKVLGIIAHNKDTTKTWRKTITKFTGMTLDELKGSAIMDEQSCSATNGVSGMGLNSFPAYFDWRQIGVVSQVKDQGNCGSCWTFSTTGAVEANWAIYKATTPPLLSEQQLVDCAGDFNNHGCNGGLPSQAFEYIKSVGGLETESDYPYKAADGTCAFDKSKVAASVFLGSVNITEGDEQALQEALFSVGPISIAFEVTDDFVDYDSGVYVGQTCHNTTDTVNHAVLAVGFGTDGHSNLDYWIVKNSWSPAWGEEGYFRIQRGTNMCGIAVCASYPHIKH